MAALFFGDFALAHEIGHAGGADWVTAEDTEKKSDGRLGRQTEQLHDWREEWRDFFRAAGGNKEFSAYHEREQGGKHHCEAKV